MTQFILKLLGLRTKSFCHFNVLWKSVSITYGSSYRSPFIKKKNQAFSQINALYSAVQSALQVVTLNTFIDMVSEHVCDFCNQSTIIYTEQFPIRINKLLSRKTKFDRQVGESWCADETNWFWSLWLKDKVKSCSCLISA